MTAGPRSMLPDERRRMIAQRLRQHGSEIGVILAADAPEAALRPFQRAGVDVRVV